MLMSRVCILMLDVAFVLRCLAGESTDPWSTTVAAICAVLTSIQCCHSRCGSTERLFEHLQCSTVIMFSSLQILVHDAASAIGRWTLRLQTFWRHRAALHALARRRYRIAFDIHKQAWFHYIPRPGQLKFPADELPAREAAKAKVRLVFNLKFALISLISLFKSQVELRCDLLVNHVLDSCVVYR